MMDVERTVRDYLREVIHLSLATTLQGQPWVCEVHFVFDKNLNLFFRSKPSRRHSEEIEQNDRVAGNIIKEHTLEDKVRGVYFEGTAQRLDR